MVFEVKAAMDDHTGTDFEGALVEVAGIEAAAENGEALEVDKGVGEEALKEAARIAAAKEERAEDEEALDEDEHVGEEVLEEAARIPAAVEECSKVGEALEEDKHIGE